MTLSRRSERRRALRVPPDPVWPSALTIAAGVLVVAVVAWAIVRG